MRMISLCVLYLWTNLTKVKRRFYLENVFITGAAVCVVGYICDCSIFLHSYCPHRHHHLLSSQHSCVQDLCVLQRKWGKSSCNQTRK